MALLSACSSSSGGGSAATDGGTDGVADGPVADAGQGADVSTANEGGLPDALGPACNTIANVAQHVTVQQVAQDPPQPQGGPIADGTYVLTGLSIYTGPGGPTGPAGETRTTVQITGGTIQVASDSTPPTQTVSLVTSGTTFTATDTCPDTNVTQGSFTATSTSFVIFLDGGTDDAGTRTVVETLTKQ